MHLNSKYPTSNSESSFQTCSSSVPHPQPPACKLETAVCYWILLSPSGRTGEQLANPAVIPSSNSFLTNFPSLHPYPHFSSSEPLYPSFETLPHTSSCSKLRATSRLPSILSQLILNPNRMTSLLKICSLTIYCQYYGLSSLHNHFLLFPPPLHCSPKRLFISP